MCTPLLRRVTSEISLTVSEPADLVFSVALSAALTPEAESLTFSLGDRTLPAEEIAAPAFTRLHRVRDVPVGQLSVSYSATVPTGGLLPPATELDPILYTRPSRYCDSDRLAAVAATHFGSYTGEDLVRAVHQWVLTHITYAPGSSDVVDGALEAYLTRQGVCRDSAQLIVTFLRARGIPARLVSVYAPGLVPMDFHAVAEVLLDGIWYVVDGTGLAPRESMVRIATGRDASDTAFLTVLGGRVQLAAIQVTATAEPGLPADDGASLIQLW